MLPNEEDLKKHVSRGRNEHATRNLQAPLCSQLPNFRWVPNDECEATFPTLKRDKGLFYTTVMSHGKYYGPFLHKLCDVFFTFAHFVCHFCRLNQAGARFERKAVKSLSEIIAGELLCTK